MTITEKQIIRAARHAAIALARATGQRADTAAIASAAADILGPTKTEIASAKEAIGSGAGVTARRAIWAEMKARRASAYAAAYRKSGQFVAETDRAILAWYRSLPAADRRAEDARRDREALASRIRAAGYREPVNGDMAVSVSEGATSVSTETEVEWKKYGRHGYRKAITGLSVSVRVRVDYAQRVPEALRVVDGLVTLDADSLPAPSGAPEGVVFFSAAWIVQARGCDLRLDRGVIATVETDGKPVAVHGGTWRTAMASLIKRAGLPDPRAAERAARDATAEARRQARKAARGPFRAAFAPAVARLEQGDHQGAMELAGDALGVAPQELAEVQITRRHAQAAGLCATGIADWCARWEVDGRSISLGVLLRLVARVDDRRDLAVQAIEEALWSRFGASWARNGARMAS